MRVSRKIYIDVDEEIGLFLQQERSRLLTQYGLRVTSSDIVKTLIKQHKMRVIQAAEENNALLWYYLNMQDRENDRTSETAFSPKIPKNRTSRRQKRKAKK